ncbi:hypothetical protein Ndes2526B_g08336 [Nannochloris sp. 'desiccata']|nr:hypothetical protein NADE_001062 [Chlorella desiccata (nom. nud.)]
MWLLWRRLGTEGYYTGLDKQFGSLQQNMKTLEDGKQRRDLVWNHIRSRFAAGFFAIYMIILAYAAWVMQQPSGKFSSIGHAKRVAPAFIAPIMAWSVYRVTDRLRSLFDRRADAQIKRLKEKLGKMVAELKDSTRYQRTQALIEKYDPEHQQKMMAVGGGGGRGNPTSEQQRKLNMQAGNGSRVLASSSSGRKLADRATSAAAGAVTGAGVALSSALGQLVSSAAKNLIGDDPTVVSMLNLAQAQAKELERENAELRRMLGWPQRGAMGHNIGNLGGGGGTGGADFAFGSPVSQTPDPDAVVESPRAFSPPPSLSRNENKSNSELLEKEQDGGGGGGDGINCDATPPAEENADAVSKSGRKSPT